jgi:hypothetical protein
MPAVARALLERMAGGGEHQSLCIDLDANGGWKLDFA